MLSCRYETVNAYETMDDDYDVFALGRDGTVSRDNKAVDVVFEATAFYEKYSGSRWLLAQRRFVGEENVF